MHNGQKQKDGRMTFSYTNYHQENPPGKGIIIGDKASQHPVITQLTNQKIEFLTWYFLENWKKEKTGSTDNCNFLDILFKNRSNLRVVFVIACGDDDSIKELACDSWIPDEIKGYGFSIGILIGRQNIFGIEESKRFFSSTDVRIVLEDDDSQLLQKLQAITAIMLMPLQTSGYINMRYCDIKHIIHNQGVGYLGIITLPSEFSKPISESIHDATIQIQNQFPGKLLEEANYMLIYFYSDDNGFLLHHCNTLLGHIELLSKNEDLEIIWNVKPCDKMDDKTTMFILLTGYKQFQD